MNKGSLNFSLIWYAPLFPQTVSVSLAMLIGQLKQACSYCFLDYVLSWQLVTMVTTSVPPNLVHISTIIYKMFFFSFFVCLRFCPHSCLLLLLKKKLKASSGFVNSRKVLEHLFWDQIFKEWSTLANPHSGSSRVVCNPPH